MHLRFRRLTDLRSIPTDNSGSINAAEFGRLVYDLGYKMDTTDVQAAVRALDKDHSGYASCFVIGPACFLRRGVPIFGCNFATSLILAHDSVSNLACQGLTESLIPFFERSLISFQEFFTWWSSNDKFKKLELENNQLLRQAVEYFRRYDTDDTGKIGLAGTNFSPTSQDLGLWRFFFLWFFFFTV